MKRIVILFLAISVCIFSCTDRDDEISAVNIRIKNASTFIFDEVQVGDAEELHMNLAPDAYSAYLEYELAYSYAYIEIKSGEDTFVLQPIDFVGESELPLGFYTYELNVNEEGDVSLNFVID